MSNTYLLVMDTSTSQHRVVGAGDIVLRGDGQPFAPDKSLDEILAVGNDADNNSILNLSAVVVGAATALTNGGDVQLLGSGVLTLKETTTPTADANHGKVYCKNDNVLYFQDGAGVEHNVLLDAAGDFADGGEAGGAARSLGNSDAFALSLLTSNLARLTLAADGVATFAGAVNVGGNVGLGANGIGRDAAVLTFAAGATGTATLAGNLNMGAKGIGNDNPILTFAAGAAGAATLAGNLNMGAKGIGNDNPILTFAAGAAGTATLAGNLNMGAKGIGNDSPILTFAAGAAGAATLVGDLNMGAKGIGNDNPILTFAAGAAGAATLVGNLNMGAKGIGNDNPILTFAAGAAGAATLAGNLYMGAKGIGRDAAVLTFATGATGIASFSGQVKISDSATLPPLNIAARAVEPSAPNSADIYLDDGTNTASGYPGWRRFNGATWDDIGAVSGSSGGGEFADGGEATGARRTLGNTDDFEFGFLSNNIEVLTLSGTTITANVSLILGSVNLDMTDGYYLQWNSGADYILATGGAMYFATNSVGLLRLDGTGDVIIGTQAQLAAAANYGFMFIPEIADTPSGAPGSYTGEVAMCYDSNNDKLWVYDGSWVGVSLA